VIQLQVPSLSSPPDFDHQFLAEVDLLRLLASQKLDSSQKRNMGQFLTPSAVAELMAGMFENWQKPEICLLDAGAGIGSLSAAFVDTICQLQKRPLKLRIIAYEIETFFLNYLQQTLNRCAKECEKANIALNYEIRPTDFIEAAVNQLQPNLFDQSENIAFTHAILNPPYFKINAIKNYLIMVIR
jgi:adenine-specific DNA-methyltransferase